MYRLVMVSQTNELVRRLASLPDSEQAVLADYLQRHLPEVLDEARWQALFAESDSVLDGMGLEVDNAIAGGEVAPLDPEEL